MRYLFIMTSIYIWVELKLSVALPLLPGSQFLTHLIMKVSIGEVYYNKQMQ